jgi:hypothetical protein
MKNFEWPTREEWAESQRAFYHDRFEDLEFDRQLSAYASDQEIDVAVRALRALWKVKGVRLLALCVPKGFQQQRGETQRSYYVRINAMTSEERELLENYLCYQGERRRIKKIIKTLLDNEVPPQCRWVESSGYSECTDGIPEEAEVDKALGAIAVRYVGARAAAEEKRKQEILATPIDDAAWEKELQRRESIERHRSDPLSIQTVL